jgi:predicted ATPase/DNA-binding SARP family transcriptional activator
MRIGMLGPLEVRSDSDDIIHLGGARVCRLLARLAYDAGRVVTSEQLIDAVWDGVPPSSSTNALQALVSRLRRALPGDVIESHPRGYRLAIEPDQVDVLRFKRLADAGKAAAQQDPRRAVRTLGDALGMWRGPAFADLTGAEFAEAAASSLDQRRLAAVEDRAEATLALADRPPDLDALEQVVAEFPRRERAVGLLMRALAAVGRPADALSAYEKLRETLADELGADPSPDIADLHVRILRGELTPQRRTALTGARSNLRTGITSFIGREDEMRRVGKLVGENRLTTLTGPGGAGKTRLATEAASALIDAHPDGVWMVELAPLSTASALPQVILAALGLHEMPLIPQPRAKVAEGPSSLVPDWARRLDQLAVLLDTRSETVDRLTSALADRDILLVLDNCEHLIEPVAALVDHLLGECAGLRILASSREPLGITGEAIWNVGPLDLPPAHADAVTAGNYPAMRLFVDRVTATFAEFELDSETVDDAVRVCRALDGMPLAIELAAARLRSMTLSQVADRLDDRFSLLSAGNRSALPRHQTLHATVDWSWSLLSDVERMALRRIAIFAGGASTDAAAHLMAVDDSGVDDVIDVLAALTEKSLVILDRSCGGPRYRLLETIKAFGLDRLAEAGETELARRAHAEYFADLVDEAEPKLRTADQLYWLGRLDQDYDNIHQALNAAIDAEDALTSVRLVAALGWYWNLRAKRYEGFQLAVRALELPGEVPDDLRALAYLNGGLCAAYSPFDVSTGERLFEEATALIDRLGPSEHPMLRIAQPMVAMIRAWSAGQPWDVADHVFDDPDPWVRGSANMLRAYSYFFAGEHHDRGEDDLSAALDAFRQAGDRTSIAAARSGLAEVTSWRGQFDAAIAHISEAVSLVTELQSVEEIVHYRVILARLTWLSGAHEAARAELAEAQRLATQIGLPEVQISAALAATDISLAAGELRAAAEHVGRAAEISETSRQDSGCDVYVTAARGRVILAGGALDRDLDDDTPMDRAAATNEAAAYFRRALELAVKSGDSMAVAHALVGVAGLALARDDAGQAAALLGASVAIRGTEDRAHFDVAGVTAATRNRLGDGMFTKAIARGRSVTSIQAASELADVTLGA